MYKLVSSHWYQTIMLSMLIYYMIPTLVYADKSITLTQSGAVTVGEEIPFFSGWKVGTKHKGATNSNKALESDKDRYVITLCATWCVPCMKGLEVLAQNQSAFRKSNTQLIVIVADSHSNAQTIYHRFNLKWATFILDEFKTIVAKMSPNKQNSQGVSLPKTFVLDKNKIVTRIIAQEGTDFISLLLHSK